MRPQHDEPCITCKNWDGRTKCGCKLGRYNCDTMIIWGVCRTYEKKKGKKAKFDKPNYEE